jgi:hypothetical protein
MVLRIVGIAVLMTCVLLALHGAPAQAAYRGPAGGVPFNSPAPGPNVVPVGPGFVVAGPAMAMPRPMSCMPACPPPCAPGCPPPCMPPCGPPSCAPDCQPGFNPLSAVWGMVSLPFKLIGGMFSSKKDCDIPLMCPPSCCMPMLPPQCAACPPVAKVKAPKGPRAAYRHVPMPVMQ